LFLFSEGYVMYSSLILYFSFSIFLLVDMCYLNLWFFLNSFLSLLKA